MFFPKKYKMGTVLLSSFKALEGLFFGEEAKNLKKKYGYFCPFTSVM